MTDRTMMEAPTADESLVPTDPSPGELGRRIKLLRVSRGLTLKHLEERGGISATHVSEIERGKASPTVGALARIARALGVRPSTLVEPNVRPEVAIMRPAERQKGRIVSGAARLEPVAEPAREAHLDGHLMTLPIGREAALVHRHEGEEWVTVLSGAAEVRIEGHAHALREGDAIHFRAHRVHAYTNLASTPAILLVVSHPRVSM